MSCEWITLDPASLYPFKADRKPPSENLTFVLDWAVRLDCEGAGNTLVASTWSVHPDDDDGTLTITNDTYAGMQSEAHIGGGTDGKNYRVINQVTDAGGQVSPVTISIPVLETRAATY